MATKIIYAAIFSSKSVDAQDEPTLLVKASNLKSYPFYKRSSIEGFCTFLSREVAKRCTREGVLECFRDSEYFLDLTLAKEGYSDYLRQELHNFQIQSYALISQQSINRIIFITTTNYPSSPILRLSIDLLNDFSRNHNVTPFTLLQERVDQCQNPKDVDKIAFIQSEIEETKLIMISNIDAILKRGEKLEDLLEKTTDISESSKTFLKKSKKLNRWCC